MEGRKVKTKKTLKGDLGPGLGWPGPRDAREALVRVFGDGESAQRGGFLGREDVLLREGLGPEVEACDDVLAVVFFVGV